MPISPYSLSFVADAAAFSNPSTRAHDPFEYLRTAFLVHFGDEIYESLNAVLGDSVTLSRAPLSHEVSGRFLTNLQAFGSLGIAPALHGTRSENYEGIFRRGLLIPGPDTGVAIANGSAHGVGIYTASLNAPWLSRTFCSDPSMLVCAVLQSSAVNHIRDAQVVFDAGHVIPLFVGHAPSFSSARSLPLPLPTPLDVIEPAEQESRRARCAETCTLKGGLKRQGQLGGN